MDDFNSQHEKIHYIMNLIDQRINKLRPNFGYIEKLTLCSRILAINNYLLPDDDSIIETMNLILSNGKG